MSADAPTATAEALEHYLQLPVAPPAAETLQRIEGGPVAPREALRLEDAERLLDPAPLATETGWTVLADGVAHVAVETSMPGVSGEMVDWWFDWHPREAIRYRVWHPRAHHDNALDPPPAPRAKAHWGAVHHPVEDVGTGVVRARIAFCSPREMGFCTDALGDPRVATIVCGYAGDDARHVRHTAMFHVFLRSADGVRLRSHFWLGAAIAPYGPLSSLGGALLNRPAVRRRVLPARLPRALSLHCAEEYTRLGALLPELYERFAAAGS